MTDVLRARPRFDPALCDGRGGFYCGHCGSADHWVETQTDVGCANCGTYVPGADAEWMALLEV